MAVVTSKTFVLEPFWNTTSPLDSGSESFVNVYGIHGALLPLVPDVPVVPLLPDEPLEPELPDEPEEPLVPDVPLEPDVPELPDAPLSTSQSQA